MYYPRQILKGIRNPTVAKRKFQQKLDVLNALLPHEIGVQGSYRTGNVGDLAIGQSLRQRLTADGYDTRLFGKETVKNRSRVPVLGGGGVLHDWYGSDHLRLRLGFLSDTGAVIGVGVPGFKTSEARQLVRNELEKVDLITVRDKASRNQLEPVYDGEIYVTACPALLLDDPKEDQTKKTGVNFRPWFELESETLSYYFGYNPDIDVETAKRQYIQNARFICQTVDEPVFIPFHKQDEEFAKKHLDIPVLPYNFSVSTTLRRVSAVKRMVTTRYHSLVFSIICQKPTMAIGYAPKVVSLANRVEIEAHDPHNEEISVTFEKLKNRRELECKSVENLDLLRAHVKNKIE